MSPSLGIRFVISRGSTWSAAQILCAVILSFWERVEYPLMLVEEVLKPLHYTQMWIHVWVLLLTPLY